MHFNSVPKFLFSFELEMFIGNDITLSDMDVLYDVLLPLDPKGDWCKILYPILISTMKITYYILFLKLWFHVKIKLF